MIGDTNLYLSENIDEVVTAEVGVMIAEPSWRGRGRGKEAMLLMMRYGESYSLAKLFSQGRNQNFIL